MEKIHEAVEVILGLVENLDLQEKVVSLNYIREHLHNISPFKNEPVDYVQWVENTDVYANDYNPNSVAPPEMKLLERSIDADGYTQPIVSWPTENGREVIDGFHRHRVGKESKIIQERVKGYLPVVTIRLTQEGKKDRIASTIRHNRARGKHNVDSMSDIVVELKKRNWSTTRIMRELGMDEDEVLRLCQITGLSDLFSDREFSAAWDVDKAVTEEDFEELTDDIEKISEIAGEVRLVNSEDESRVFHTFDKWECYKAGFYNTSMEGIKKPEAEEIYKEFLSNDEDFKSGLNGVITEWKNSCEHYLTNVAMNRIAWIGQAAACFEKGLPARFRSGYNLLSEKEQDKANNTALEYINLWMKRTGREEISLNSAISGDRQSDIY